MCGLTALRAMNYAISGWDLLDSEAAVDAVVSHDTSVGWRDFTEFGLDSGNGNLIDTFSSPT